MTKYYEYFVLALVLVVLSIAVCHRTIIFESGRTLTVAYLDESAPGPHVTYLQSISDHDRTGDLSLLSGKEILDVFHSQIPVNPVLLTQRSLLKIDPQKTYLITESRSIFERLKQNLDKVRVYRNQQIVFNGVRYPDAFILESSRPEKELRNIRVGPAPPVKSESSHAYLRLQSQRELNLLFRGLPPEKSINLITPPKTRIQPDQIRSGFLEKIGAIYVIGKNAIFPHADTSIDEDTLYLLSSPAELPLNSGSIQPLPASFYWWSSILFLLCTLILARTRGIPLEGLLLVAGLGIALLVSHFQMVFTGLLVSVVIYMGFSDETITIPWFGLAGLWTYGFVFQPYIYAPFYRSEFFWIGILGAGAFLLIYSEEWGHEPITRFEVLSVLGGIALLSYGFVATTEKTLMLFAQAVTIFPLFFDILSNDTTKNSHVWIFSLLAWMFVFFRPIGFVGILWFLYSVLIWYGYSRGKSVLNVR